MTGCDFVDWPWGPAMPRSLVYYNSFETPADTCGLPLLGSVVVVRESAPGCGKQSIQVSGGCLVPHAGTRIAGPARDAYVELRCWGKNLLIGGGVEICRISALHESVYISVTTKEWTFLQSDTTLFVPGGDSLDIWMNAGGIAASAMLIDGLQVVIVQ
jgi:hypothetical protein